MGTGWAAPELLADHALGFRRGEPVADSAKGRWGGATQNGVVRPSKAMPSRANLSLDVLMPVQADARPVREVGRKRDEHGPERFSTR